MSLRIGGFRPHLAPTLITLPIVVLCLGLGVWQVERLHWKEGLIAQRAATLAAPPVMPPLTLAQARPLALRRVADQGVFLYDREILVHAIGPAGGAGFDVLTPLREAGGRIVFVNRGFVPTRLKDRASRRAGEPSGNVHVAGRLRLASQKPGWFVPDNTPARGEWYWIDLAAISAADRLAPVAPFYIDADAAPNPGGWPEGGVTLPELPNHHLQYAITWFALAVAALVIYVLSQRPKAGGR
ncbi:MAG TPA: SURF1 family protein [Stellaceae bacterium]|nr:SURF1 family protein [Stellaceae bacterium]